MAMFEIPSRLGYFVCLLIHWSMQKMLQKLQKEQVLNIYFNICIK